MVVNLRSFLFGSTYVAKAPHLFVIGLIVSVLEVWMIIEIVLHLRRKREPEAEVA